MKTQGGFLGMLFGTLDASILGNMLMGKGAMRAGKGTGRTRRGYNAMIHMSKIF